MKSINVNTDIIYETLNKIWGVSLHNLKRIHYRNTTSLVSTKKYKLYLLLMKLSTLCYVRYFL